MKERTEGTSIIGRLLFDVNVVDFDAVVENDFHVLFVLIFRMLTTPFLTLEKSDLLLTLRRC